MIEYYGWISISDSPYESNVEDMHLIYNEISSYISKSEMESTSGFIKLHQVNGSYQLLVSGNTNHLSQDVVDIFHLYEYIAKIALGSYGLLYFKNDESLEAFNEFEVFVLARGKIEKRKDTFLSPCVPIIEDGD